MVEKKDGKGTENEFLHLSFYNNNIFCTFPLKRKIPRSYIRM